MSEFKEENADFEDVVNKKMTALADAVHGQVLARTNDEMSQEQAKECCTKEYCIVTGDRADIAVTFRGTIFIRSRSELDQIDKTRQDDMRRWGYAIFRDFTTEPKLYCSSCGEAIAPEDIDSHLVPRQEDGPSRPPQ